MPYTDEMLFCIKHLYLNGFFPATDKKIEEILTKYSIPDYRFVKMNDEDFFEKLALSLRELWPAGEKDGKYPWRDSVENLKKRLYTLWTNRDLSKYTYDDCMTAARKYLSQFENNVKYMCTLKYFIFKQDKLVENSGRVRYVYNSKFADILEGLSEMEKQQQDVWSEVEQVENIQQGVLI